ncbi:ShlB/FhaC/HecB family hemolysin secretion/activation protein [Novosphingobium sp. ERN07]|uniref:ShlB/FhaC/HecB family hemolysin secretion/activation protein n=1 Tax=Novosphingobium sp. ERN07 TaxID=2726187 RepID=UPI001456E75A|nr:ShlB/FhaC/HecB family hemolysin secretion/activation protein [Novosphingobium sp. ERN07]NLR71752.1 ShlB/FhaC/HecB family hemolysin secretion/activation protein [Novosphingobium sp. ERN07]
MRGTIHTVIARALRLPGKPCVASTSLLAFMAVTIPSTAAFAQAVLPPGAAEAGRQADTIQRQQQERVDEDTTRILTRPQSQTVIEVPTHEQAEAAPGSCQTINRIEFEHSPLLSEKGQERLTAPYLGRCLGLGDVENLLSDITRYYIEKSRPTTRVYIKPQNLAQGVLVLDVVEGRVEKVILDDNAKGTVNLFTAFGLVRNNGFNLRVFEQGLDQINRLASNHASLDITPGSKPGYSIVKITNRPDSRLHLSASIDNTGQTNTGRRQGTGTIILDDPLGLNEMWSYTRRQTIFENRPNTDSHSNNLLFSLPFNALTFTGGYNDSEYRSQTVTDGGTVFVLTGASSNAFGRVDAAVWRNARNKVELSAQLTNKRNRNFINGIFLPVSSRVLTTVALEANWSVLIGRGSFRAGVGWTKGIDGLGALDDSTIARTADTPHAQFDKLTARAAFVVPLQAGNVRITSSTEFEALYGFDPLYANEQIVIGSPFTVRGFFDNSLIGDRGFYLQQEFSSLLPVQIGRGQAFLRPHVSFDLGRVAPATAIGARGTLAGVAAGLGLTFGPVNLDITGSRSIARGPLPDEGFLAFARATISF